MCVRMAVQSLTTNIGITIIRIGILIDSSLTVWTVNPWSVETHLPFVCQCMAYYGTVPGEHRLWLSAKRKTLKLPDMWRIRLAYLLGLPLLMSFNTTTDGFASLLWLSCLLLYLKHRFRHSFLFIKISFHWLSSQVFHSQSQTFILNRLIRPTLVKSYVLIA